MQSPSASDPSFKAFLDKLQEQNNRSFIAQLVQLKAEREIAGEDNDKREKQLDSVISSLGDVRSAVTGVKLDIDLTPLVNIGENQTKLLEELSKEASLTRKLTEGSVEYDKEAAQYRNISGRDIESKVSGKISKDGGFLDFETARDTLSGQGKRVREANAFDLKPINYTPGKTIAAAVGGKGSPAGGKEEKPVKEVDTRSFFEVFKDELKAAPGRIRDNLIGYTPEKTDGREKKTEVDGAGIEPNAPEPITAKPQVTGINSESDNVASTGEIMADTAKSDLELSKQMLDTTKAQLIELKAIREALAPKIPKELVEQKGGATDTGTGTGEGGGGGLGLGDMLPSGKKIGRALKNVGRGALSLGGKALKFMGGKGGAIAGGVLAVGAGAYTAYEGYTAAEDSKNAKLEEVQAKVDTGEMKPEEAAAARKEIGNTATVEKSGAVGEGTGMAVGAIAGMKAGAMLGAFGGPIGAGVGAIAGGALGAFAGSSGGKYIGEKIGGGINAVKGFFGGKTDAPGAATKEALAPAPATVKSETTKTETTTDSVFNEAEFAKKDPDTFKKYQEFKDKRTDEIAQKDPFFKTDRKGAYSTARGEAIDEAKAKFKKEIDAVGANKVETKTEEKVTGGPGAKNPVTAGEAGAAAITVATLTTAAQKPQLFTRGLGRRGDGEHE